MRNSVDRLHKTVLSGRIQFALKIALSIRIRFEQIGQQPTSCLLEDAVFFVAFAFIIMQRNRGTERLTVCCFWLALHSYCLQRGDTSRRHIYI
jgi:hypothetical protein